ncbi:hypothetical protein [Geobacter argillaceus]|uniref:Uncharacterized protein n=1 Tax=Geobacter argillaceus TaxID=345631 RepID=A0A562V666_9BACT|nr:hypothetical protein [Geobacter argillaceus]TWJ13400.1 hypothetical protein JN12_03838 [Geobacter argillaceus]
MSVLSIILVLAAVIAAFFLVGVLTMYRSMFMSTRGKRIADYPNPRKALVILDIQEGGRIKGSTLHIPFLR